MWSGSHSTRRDGPEGGECSDYTAGLRSHLSCWGATDWLYPSKFKLTARCAAVGQRGALRSVQAREQLPFAVGSLAWTQDRIPERRCPCCAPFLRRVLWEGTHVIRRAKAVQEEGRSPGRAPRSGSRAPEPRGSSRPGPSPGTAFVRTVGLVSREPPI